MIKNEVCFNIENTEIVLEQVLVDYMDIPIFFLCKNQAQYFIALCTNIDELNYIVTKLSTSDVYDLLHCKIPMRDVILKQNEYWNIIPGDNVLSDVIEKKSIDSLNKELLPEENACFEVLTKKVKLFVEKFDREFFENKHFNQSEKKADLSAELQLDSSVQSIKFCKELADYKLEKSSFGKIISYKDNMNWIKTIDIPVIKLGVELVKDEHEFADLYMNIMTDAA